MVDWETNACPTRSWTGMIQRSEAWDCLSTQHTDVAGALDQGIFVKRQYLSHSMV